MKNIYQFLFLLTLVSTCYGQSSPTLPANHPFIEYMGRVIKSDSAVILNWTGTTVSTFFKGTGIKALLKDQRGDNYYNVLVDGKLTMILHPDSLKKTYTLASGLRYGAHHLELFKRTEWAMGKTWLYSLTTDTNTRLFGGEKDKRNRGIEFYGNSITCGYAVEDSSGKDRGTAPYENAYTAYAAITARHYHADFHCIAKSGIGVLVSWFPLIMPEMWDRLDPEDPTSKWDFSKFDPDLVVINLFQNDAWLVAKPDHEQFKARFGNTAPTPQTIIAAYKKLVQQIREKRPDAYFICMLGNMDATREGAPWPGYIKEAVRQLHDKKMFTLIVPYKGTPGHPNGAEQQVLADSLIHFIDEHIKW